jgi:3-hydroxymyristoyl/3-hydroxydecanoyl-(acyl carrier protein) dehydratase
MELQDILGLIPHRPPLLLVDRVEEIEPGKRLVGIKKVQPGSWEAGAPQGVPGPLVVEALAQCGGILALKSLGHDTQPKDTRFFFLGIDQCQFGKPAMPGDILKLEVEVLRGKGKVYKLKGRATAADALVCEAEITIAQQVGGA